MRDGLAKKKGKVEQPADDTESEEEWGFGIDDMWEPVASQKGGIPDRIKETKD